MTQAEFKPSRWPGLIWAVPVAALAIVLWLGLGAWMRRGPSVTVDFPVTGGLRAGSSKAEYRGFTVGTVESVKLLPSLRRMTVRISFAAPMKGHLGPGTRYWIAGTNLNFSSVEAAKALLSGPFIGVDPKPGPTVASATGLDSPPVLKYEPRGITVTLVSGRMAHLSPGSPVYFKDFKVGEIRGVSMQPDGRRFLAYAFIPEQYVRLLDRNSRFWSAGAVRLSTGGAGAGVELQSLPALLIGAVAFETPDEPPGAPAPDGQQFRLYPNESAARDAPGPGAVPFRVVFAGSPRGLRAGAPVQLEDTPVGGVTAVAMRYDAARGALETVVTLTLDPGRLGLKGERWNWSDPAPRMDGLIRTLVSRGLRAELASSAPVIGGELVQLAIVPGLPPATLGGGDPPEIPSFAAGGDVGQILARIDAVAAKLDAMPLDQIADNIRQVTDRLAALSASPQMKRSLERLDRTVAQVDDLTRQADARVPDILQAIQRAAVAAQDAMGQVRGLLNAQRAANAAAESTDLPHALYELSQAAQSLRQLTDYLNSHPNALIFGRR